MAEPRDNRRGVRKAEPDDESKAPKSRPWGALLVIGGLMVLFFWASSVRGAPTTIRYDEFKERVRAGRVEEVWLGADFVRGRLRRDNPDNAVALRGVPPLRSPGAADFQTARVADDRELVSLLEANHVRYAGEPDRSSWWIFMAAALSPLALMLLLVRMSSRRAASQQSSVLAFGRSKGKVAGDDEVKVRFDDVAGVDEAKDELKEIVDFLRTPEKFTRIGARIPKGVLLVGPPGTGKTLLAKAVAGEAGVPFFNISGSEFVEMFVGVGAARVRDLFEQAQGHAPCIVFIDELDALGRSRGANAMGSNEEREQTLNQLLVEMDGFGANKGVIIMAATNRPEILDPALLRPGRFDRQVLVDRPDRVGREAILRVHARDVKLDPSVDLAVIAARTPGFAGADLANIINEAALLAARRDKATVSMSEVSEAIDRVVAGLEKKSRIISPQERLRVAYHEAGHAIVGEVLPGAEKTAKISIVPRGMAALGYTMHLPTEDRHLMTEPELRARLAATLGGRAAERIIFGDLSTGASNDLARATELARAMVTEYGMSEKVGPLSFTGRGKSSFLGGDIPGPRDYGDRMGDLVDDEVRSIVEGAEKTATELLTERKAFLEQLAKVLLEKEYLDGDELRRLLEVARNPSLPPPAPAAAAEV